MLLIETRNKFIENLELLLARFVYDGQQEEADKLCPVVEDLQDGYYVIAYFLAQENGLPQEIVQGIKDTFQVLDLA